MKRHCYWCGEIESQHTQDSPIVSALPLHVPWFLNDSALSNAYKAEEEITCYLE